MFNQFDFNQAIKSQTADHLNWHLNEISDETLAKVKKHFESTEKGKKLFKRASEGMGL